MRSIAKGKSECSCPSFSSYSTAYSKQTINTNNVFGGVGNEDPDAFLTCLILAVPYQAVERQLQTDNQVEQTSASSVEARLRKTEWRATAHKSAWRPAELP